MRDTRPNAREKARERKRTERARKRAGITAPVNSDHKIILSPEEKAEIAKAEAEVLKNIRADKIKSMAANAASTLTAKKMYERVLSALSQALEEVERPSELTQVCNSITKVLKDRHDVCGPEAMPDQVIGFSVETSSKEEHTGESWSPD